MQITLFDRNSNSILDKFGAKPILSVPVFRCSILSLYTNYQPYFNTFPSDNGTEALLLIITTYSLSLSRSINKSRSAELRDYNLLA